MKTLYDILGVSSLATQEDIATAYQRVLQQYNSELASGAGEHAQITMKIDAIDRAHTTLISPEKRMEYDGYISRNHTVAHLVEKRNYDGAFSSLIGSAGKPLVVILVVIAVLYMALEKSRESERSAMVDRSDARRDERQAQELSIVEKSVEYDAQVRNRQIELERERLRLHNEALRWDQERANAALQSRENAGHLPADIAQRQLDERIWRNVANTRATVELQKDAAAAKIGVTRRQYDQLQREKFDSNTGWNNSPQ